MRFDAQVQVLADAVPPVGEPHVEPPAMAPQYHPAVVRIMEMFPDIPVDVITRDLEHTRSIDRTIDNLLEQRVAIVCI